MKSATAADVKANFGSYLKAAEEDPVIITRQGKPVAILVPAGDAEDVERLLMAHSPKLQAILEAARERFRADEGVPHETFWQEVQAESARKGAKPRKTRKKPMSKK